MIESKQRVFRFLDVEVYEREFYVRKAGVAVQAEPRVFQLLLFLLQNPKRLATKQELLDSVWGDAAVSESSLTRSIALLRRILDDDAREPRYIETVAKVGYRFLCDVVEREERPETEQTPETFDLSKVGFTFVVPVEPAPDQLEQRDTPDLPTAPTEYGRSPITPGSAERLPLTRSAVWIELAAIFILLLVFVGGSLWRTHSREKWARETATPEIIRLMETGEYPKAAALALRAHAILPNDITIRNLWVRVTGEVSIKSDPAGAEVWYRPYHGDPAVWTRLGQTPVSKVRVPQDSYVWRLTKQGFADETFIAKAPGILLVGDVWNFDVTLKLQSQSQVPPEMVPVGGGLSGMTYPLLGSPDVKLDDFLIDRHEVTNAEYQKFVDAGGYSKPQFWKEPFVKDGRQFTWEKAVGLFRDSTGRPGPATWEAGHFPTGQGDHPVSGVSWYEAAAYAKFVGKSLPTAYHWMRASQADANTPLIASGSNFGSEGTQPVGETGTLSGWGTTDMAGNVKEWCLNETRDAKRLILGGGFGEPDYMFNFTDAQSPWERRPNYGFRCMKLLSPPNLTAQRSIDSSTRDFWKEKPVADEIFKAYKELYSYDKTPLNARVEERSLTDRDVRERVTFDAAYSGERVTAYLFLPRNMSPPWQTVVFFPGAMATLNDTLDLTSVENAYDFILKSGRTIVVPIYKGTYQRRDGFIPGRNKPAFFRDHVVAWSKDLSRTIDYLESRGDFDTAKMAYMGYSLGGAEAPVLLAIDRRFKAAIVLSGGFQMRYDLPEVAPFNFDPHMVTPTLMLSGRYDNDFPVESSQRPLFQFMGTPPKDKKLVIYDGGHGAFPRPAAVRESLDWLDKYLGRAR
jgi:DNA-binding winged helix-turn-helix (wHTH) protein/formylglycine-generating enzyme required for sulfatase activity/dienelactone hydrolase